MTVYERTSGYLAKISENLHLNAVIELNTDALSIARELDNAEDKSGALFGLPILLKDNVDTGDKMHTTSGSMALSANVAAKDAPAAKLLRDAGAVFLGKANMTEFANYMSDWTSERKMPNGYSSRGGQTIHPADPSADPSGSSSGSAVAVAAGLCAAAIGSETYGSIISPSQKCGVVGIKPSAGLVSGEGVIPISFTLDTLGPIAGDVATAARVLAVMSGRDIPPFAGVVRMGICRNDADKTKLVWSECLAANEKLAEGLGGIGLIAVEMPNHEIDLEFFLPLMRYEFQHAMNKYLSGCVSPGVPENLAQIIACNNANAEIALKYGQSLLESAAEVGDDWASEPEYASALEKRKAAQAALNDYFDANNVDVILMTSAFCGLAALTGFPSLTLPIGKSEDNLPIGTCLIARAFCENALVAAAGLIEKQWQGCAPRAQA